MLFIPTNHSVTSLLNNFFCSLRLTSDAGGSGDNLGRAVGIIVIHGFSSFTDSVSDAVFVGSDFGVVVGAAFAAMVGLASATVVGAAFAAVVGLVSATVVGGVFAALVGLDSTTVVGTILAAVVGGASIDDN